MRNAAECKVCKGAKTVWLASVSRHYQCRECDETCSDCGKRLAEGEIDVCKRCELRAPMNYGDA